MNVKLTKTSREELRELVLKDLFGKRQTRLSVATSNLAHRIIRDQMTPKERKIYAEIPTSWLEEQGVIAVVFAGEHTRLNFVNDDGEMVNVPLPHKWRWQTIAVYERGHPFVEQFEGIQDDLRALKTERSEMNAQINAILNSVATVKALLDVWPDVKKYVPKAWLLAKVALPAVNMDVFTQKFAELKAAAA